MSVPCSMAHDGGLLVGLLRLELIDPFLVQLVVIWLSCSILVGYALLVKRSLEKMMLLFILFYLFVKLGLLQCKNIRIILAGPDVFYASGRDQRDKNMTLQAVNENSSNEIWKFEEVLFGTTDNGWSTGFF